MRDSIQVLEKPVELSWDAIHEVLWAAHKENRERGMKMRYPELTGAEIEQLLGNSGRCFVAIHDGRVVGTCSYVVRKRKTWYAKGKRVAHYILGGVLPECQGKGVYSQLMAYREKAVIESGLQIIDMDTAEQNKKETDILQHNGFRFVGYSSYPYGKHYSVVMAKWLNGCPYSSRYCSARFYLSKIKTKLRYKPGHIKRLGI